MGEGRCRRRNLRRGAYQDVAAPNHGSKTIWSLLLKVGKSFRGVGSPPESIQVRFKYFEKSMSSKRTVQKTTAMGENTKIQILAQDMVRRLLNTSEELGAGTRNETVDEYAPKLINSRNTKEQVRKIVIKGIKGYENKKRKRAMEEKDLLSTEAGSKVNRYKDKLLDKTNWFKQKRGSKNEEQNDEKIRNKKDEERKSSIWSTPSTMEQ